MFKLILKFDCVIFTFFRTLKYNLKGFSKGLYMGHTYEEVETFTNCTVYTYKCNHCGKLVTRWEQNK